jgi:anti-anti-sigma factor
MSTAALQPGLAIAGELTIYRAAELCAQLREAVAPAGDLVLDLAEVTECDTAGVQLLLAVARALEERGSRLLLAGTSAPVRDALKTLGLKSRFARAEAA